MREKNRRAHNIGKHNSFGTSFLFSRTPRRFCSRTHPDFVHALFPHNPRTIPAHFRAISTPISTPDSCSVSGRCHAHLHTQILPSESVNSAPFQGDWAPPPGPFALTAPFETLWLDLGWALRPRQRNPVGSFVCLVSLGASAWWTPPAGPFWPLRLG